MTYEAFCKEYHVSSNLIENANAKKCFKFLSSGDSIMRMITFSDMGLPAITPIALKLESMFDTKDFSMRDAKNRQTVGMMVSYIMKKFGYTCETSKRDFLRNFSGCHLFKTGATYKISCTAENAIVTKII